MKAHSIVTYSIPITCISALLSIKSVVASFQHRSLSSTAVVPQKDNTSKNIIMDKIDNASHTINKRNLAPETVVLFEDFDETSKFVFTSNGGTLFSAGQDCLGIVGLDDFGTRVRGPILESVSGFNNDNYLVSQYLIGEGAELPIKMEWQDLDISNLNTLEFSVVVAEGDANDGGNDLDYEDYIRFDYSIDGGNFQNLLWFESSSFIRSVLTVDADFSGYGYDDGEEVTDVAKTFSANIGDIGSTLTLRLALDLDNFDEDFAMDEIKITSIPNPPTEAPSAHPSVQPSSMPLTRPSLRPSAQPSTQPSVLPSSYPSLMPSNSPSDDVLRCHHGGSGFFA